MRHQKKKVTLDRKVGPRRALIKNLAESLILHERIKTTKKKAKVAQSTVERLITTARANTLAARRLVQKDLHTKLAVKKLMEVLGPRYLGRPGGYTRLTMLGARRGDGSETAVVEFI